MKKNSSDSASALDRSGSPQERPPRRAPDNAIQPKGGE